MPGSGGCIGACSGSTRVPEDFPEDLTADARDDLPWLLDRMREHFERRYYGDPPQPKPIEMTNEAILEFLDLLRAVHGALGDRIDELRNETSDSERDAGVVVPLPEHGLSANQQLLVELIPVYEALFERKLARSVAADLGTRESQRPTGPAVRFYRFVFDKLAIPDAPTDHTLSTWIRDWQA